MTASAAMTATQIVAILFVVAQATRSPSLPAPFVSAGAATTSKTATQLSWETEKLRHAASADPERWSTRSEGTQSAWPGSSRGSVPEVPTMHATSAPDADPVVMALKSVISRRAARALTPLKAEAWLRLLTASGLISRYPTLPDSILHGFVIGIRPLTSTFCPPNKHSFLEHTDAFNTVAKIEFDSGRWLGPFTREQVFAALGHFQTSPVSVIPKPGKPGASRIIQNLSYPHEPIPPAISSINSTINSSDYPCTWGTFFAFALMVAGLPPLSQAACRDIAAAFRTCGLHPSQWAGIVLRLDQMDNFAIDTAIMFGVTSGTGAYGWLADAGSDIMRWFGMGPITKWVDDHAFIRILKIYLVEYNCRRAILRTQVTTAGGRHHKGGRIWWEGNPLPDGRVPEYCEDFEFPLVDLSASSQRSTEDAKYTYAMADINRLSADLGYAWELSKDVPLRVVSAFHRSSLGPRQEDGRASGEEAGQVSRCSRRMDVVACPQSPEHTTPLWETTPCIFGGAPRPRLPHRIGGLHGPVW